MAEKDANLVAALCKAKLEFKPITKTKTAEAGKFSYSYADRATVIDATRDALAKHGLAIIHFTRFADGLFSLESTLNHVSGESMSSTWWLPDPSKTGPQQLGSALTYGMRYNTLSLLDIAAEDDLDAANIKDTTASKRAGPPSPRDQVRAGAHPPSTPDPGREGAERAGDDVVEGTVLGMINAINQLTHADDLDAWGKRHAGSINKKDLGEKGYARVREAFRFRKTELEVLPTSSSDIGGEEESGIGDGDPPWEEEEAGRQDDHVRTVLDAG